MSDLIVRYRKAAGAFVLTFVGAFVALAQVNGLELADVWAALAVALPTTGGVAALRNGPKPLRPPSPAEVAAAAAVDMSDPRDVPSR